MVGFFLKKAIVHVLKDGKHDVFCVILIYIRYNKYEPKGVFE